MNRKFRIKKVVEESIESFYPQEEKSLFWGLIKYWICFNHYDTYRNFSKLEDAVKFINEINKLSVNYTEIIPMPSKKF